MSKTTDSKTVSKTVKARRTRTAKQKSATDFSDKNQFPSIKSAIWFLFERDGYDKVGNEVALEAARAVKPDTAWKKSHLYYWRKIWKEEHKTD
jgi:hypothetical protein